MPVANDIRASLASWAAIDTVCGELIDHFQARSRSRHPAVEHPLGQPTSPYSMACSVSAVCWRFAMRWDTSFLDGVSRAFAVADHQVAHVYINDPDCLGEVTLNKLMVWRPCSSGGRPTA